MVKGVHPWYNGRVHADDRAAGGRRGREGRRSMKKTYVTTMPDHIGAFLQASRCFAGLGVNITRVSYNKAVDAHTLFLDAEGTAEQLQAADARLTEIGYLQKNPAEPSVILIEFSLPDVPGGATAVLELIEKFHFNISYMSSQETNTDFQQFKMGLCVENMDKVSEFLQAAEKLCRVRVVDYNRSEKVFDNSIFYQAFASGLAQTMGLSDRAKNELLVNANLAMQILDEQGLSPYRTFDSIRRFAELLAAGRGPAFVPRVTRHDVTEDTQVILIEPPCGSNTAIIKSGGALLFVDCGYAYYRSEMHALFRKLIPDFDTLKKTVLLTHADVDHGGLLQDFDEVLASEKSARCLALEQQGDDGFRERNPLHKPYIRICKALTGYCPPEPRKVTAMWPAAAGRAALEQVGFFSFGDLDFEVYEGAGGHLPGEIVLIDYTHRVAFTGDVYVNLHDMLPEQKQYNRYAPILMTSVDSDPALCALERRAVLQRLGAGKWQIFGGHGAKKEYEVSAG